MNFKSILVIVLFAIVAVIDTNWDLIEGLELGARNNNAIKLAGAILAIILVGVFNRKNIVKYDLGE
jgi:uncharacterized membrane protein YiaA